MAKIPLVKVGGNQNHHLFKRLDVYWVRFYKANKGRLEESLKTTFLSDARIARDKRIAEFTGTKQRTSGKGVLLEDVWPEFIKLKEAKSKGTHRINEESWRLHLEPAFGHMLIDDVDENAWLMWVIAARRLSPKRKFATEKRVIQNIMNWLHTSGRLMRCPKFENVDPERNAGKVYSETEIKALIGKADPVMKLQILMGCEMMMRHGEIWSLEWSQVDLEKKLIRLPAEKTKIRRARTFGISGAVLDLLRTRKAASNGSPWVFPSALDSELPAGRNSANNYWRKIKESANVKGRFHDLRHTGLTQAFKKSVNPALICEFAGLSLEEASKTYLHFTPEDTRVVASLYEASV